MSVEHCIHTAVDEGNGQITCTASLTKTSKAKYVYVRWSFDYTLITSVREADEWDN